MSKWDRRMLGLVNLIATWSKDPSTGVGAVIVDAPARCRNPRHPPFLGSRLQLAGCC